VRIPNAERALVEIAKLRDYCLSMDHPRGRHKARVFQRALGLTSADAEFLRDRLLAAVQSDEAALGEGDRYGQRYILDVAVVGTVREGIVRSAWIIRADEDFPRLTSCYVL